MLSIRCLVNLNEIWEGVIPNARQYACNFRSEVKVLIKSVVEHDHSDKIETYRRVYDCCQVVAPTPGSVEDTES